MDAVVDFILKLSALIGAIGVVGALLVKAYKWATAPQQISARVEALEKKQEADRKALKEKEEADREAIQSENAIICYGLSACLDGLMQLGVNHTVPEAKEKLDKFINLRAHD